MFVNPELLNQVGPLVLKTVIGLVITGLLGVIMWPVRKVKQEWTQLKKGIETANAELTQQRTNCLTTLQSQGAEQIALLKDTVNLLNGVRIDLAEQTGYLKASTQVTRVRRAAAKK